MKKVLSFLVLFLMFASVVVAGSVNGIFEGNPIVKLKVNGQEIKAKDVPAIIYNGRTMIPIYMLENLGFNISWDQKTYSVNLNSSSVKQTNNDINKITNFVKLAKQKLEKEGVKVSTLKASIDDLGLYFDVEYLLEDNQGGIAINLTKIATTLAEFNQDTSALITIYDNGQINNLIMIKTGEARKYLDKKISFEDFFKTWKIVGNPSFYENEDVAPSPVLDTTPDVIESKIDGDFEGWDGDTIFKLTNGQIWQQNSYDYLYHYAYRPDVLIYKDKYGNYKMRVEGVDEEITVIRIK